jgi:hypothetical protein
MERELAKNQDTFEKKEREKDEARTAAQSKAFREVIAANKPKAKKAKEGKAVRQAKAVAKIAKAAGKAEAKQAKEAEKARVQLAKAKKRVEQAEDKKNKGKKKTWQWSGDESEDEPEIEEDGNDKESLHWKEWVVMAHEKVVLGEDRCRFHVAMYGYPSKAGEQEIWAERKNFVSDGARELIDKYIEEHANYPPYSDLLITTKRNPKKAAPPLAQVDKSSPCHHGDFQGSYKKEDHPGHCKTGGYLHELECGGVGCKKTFAPDLKEVQRLGKNYAARPTGDKPVYCCVNISGRTGIYREKVCKHALCNECWSQAMLADDEGKTTAGTRRRATRSD